MSESVDFGVLLGTAEMRGIEQSAIASGAVTGLDLMERAGRGVVEAMFDQWPALARASFRTLVLCGPGNNGGDGFVIARILRQWGWAVDLLLLGSPDRLPPDARVNHDRWARIGPVGRLDLSAKLDLGGVDVVIDAVFGTGLSRPFEFDGLAQIAQVAARDIPAGESDHWPGKRIAVVAVDIPSGLCADSGRILRRAGRAVPVGRRAHLTVTFHRPKLGHFLAEGPESCGRLVVKPIGLETQPDPEPGIRLTVPPGGLAKASGHKYRHGHALILGGPAGRGGAARLAARAALRIGAGLVTIGSPPEAMAENAARLDAVMLRPVKDAVELNALLEDPRINALCVGPGLGTGARERALVAAALAHRGASLVLDADALTILAADGRNFAALRPDCVLTPHEGEFARLFPDIADRLRALPEQGPAYSRLEAAREAARRAGCVVLLKGEDTIIADPSGRCRINSASYGRAAPWLATAGSGDVLAGFVTGLMARGFDPFDAACAGAWLHVEAGRAFGPGLIAEDLPETLPCVLRRLLAQAA
ncbi:hydroxyethylthiazole kinase-like uncharacterized protein yjeF/hydroxyethylthiazole kinase-like uncharacterized protein yjeF [Albidovulum inexpectatum]|uniref:Bifunctional NAD(P)H-hydrate repair enzyme n=1 Tax=Albidovulum inexpectatum TaxID=196587 RepID=A0A2S5JJG3_9RHOB|nr:hydroxyethylthiazole kinase-like uncharacterized protein yjeF/hydroxyethylthiazole kinase-like uncharacterized protein yjeF [Albidovulum inexpectatum]